MAFATEAQRPILISKGMLTFRNNARKITTIRGSQLKRCDGPRLTDIYNTRVNAEWYLCALRHFAGDQYEVMSPDARSLRLHGYQDLVAPCCRLILLESDANSQIAVDRAIQLMRRLADRAMLYISRQGAAHEALGR